MNKEEILKQVRDAHEDEGIRGSVNEGLSIGYRVFLVLSMGIIIFNLFAWEKSYSVQSLFWGFIAAENYSRYKFLSKKKNQIGWIGASIASIIFLINHVLYSLG